MRVPMKSFLRNAVRTIHNQSITLNVEPSGSRDDAIKRCVKDRGALLLIDSEGEDVSQLVRRVAPQIGTTNRAFFMVQLMEAWFLADRPTLETYYGRGFNAGRLPGDPNMEAIPKSTVERRLHDATRRCRKGAYNKTTHATALLNLLNPTAVYNACPNFALLIDFLRTSDR